MRSEDVAEVYWARDAQDAHRVVTMLKANGVFARAVGGTLEGVAIEMLFVPAVSPRVWVPRSQEQLALELIERWQEPQEEREPWVCRHCEAEVEANFDICWKCQAPRQP
ncbi:MAG: DUF7577 domain-containing protein [Planctomycetota bacterium]|jgi:hypothetical protein